MAKDTVSLTTPMCIGCIINRYGSDAKKVKVVLVYKRRGRDLELEIKRPLPGERCACGGSAECYVFNNQEK